MILSSKRPASMYIRRTTPIGKPNKYGFVITDDMWNQALDHYLTVQGSKPIYLYILVNGRGEPINQSDIIIDQRNCSYAKVARVVDFSDPLMIGIEVLNRKNINLIHTLAVNGFTASLQFNAQFIHTDTDQFTKIIFPHAYGKVCYVEPDDCRPFAPITDIDIYGFIFEGGQYAFKNTQSRYDQC